MENVPYVGITDYTHLQQVARMRTVRRECPTRKLRQLHVGVMMSYKTLNDLETKWSKAFPPKEKIAEIFWSRDVMNCLHYADYEEIAFEANLRRAIFFGGPGLDALQLDMVWPDPQAIADAVDDAGKKLEIILQVGGNAIEEADNDPREVVERLRDYDGVIHRILLDKSMGRGLGMDAAGLIPFAAAVSESLPQIGLGAAGGLGPGSVHLVAPLVKEFPDLSIDAQGKLRPSGSALDPIDWDMAAQYLREAFALFQ